MVYNIVCLLIILPMRILYNFLDVHNHLNMSTESIESLVNRSKALFQKVFGSEATIVTSAPGRLNLGGEHCDYMGGYVFPFPTTLVGVVAGKRTEGKVIFANEQLLVEMSCIFRIV